MDILSCWRCKQHPNMGPKITCFSIFLLNRLLFPLYVVAVSSKTRRSTDIINMLVNIYGTKELFIKEYWNLLADRLLSNLSYSTLWEIRYFELLKIRYFLSFQ